MAQEIENNEIKFKKEKKGQAKIGAVIILIISAIVFLPAGGAAVYQSFFNGQKKNSFGSYDGKQIIYEPGTKFYKAAANIAQTRKNMGEEIDNNNFYYVLNQAFKQTILDMAFSSAVKKTGYQVPKEAINRAILPAFTDENGNFSQRMYNQVDDATLASMKSNAEGTLIFSRFVDDYFGTPETNRFNGQSLYGLKQSSEEAKFCAEMGAEKHSFDMVAFNTEDFPEEEAVSYGKNDAEKFIKYNLSIITIEDESSAKTVLKQISGNEITFEDAVSEKSKKYYSKSEGDLLSPLRYQILDILDSEDSMNEIVALKKDELSSVIKTKKGFSIFKCTGDSEAPDFENKDTVNAVLTYMKANEKSYIEKYYIDLANSFISQNTMMSFEEVAAKMNLERVEVPAFPINFKNVQLYDVPADNSIIESLASKFDSYGKIFNLKMEELSEPIVIDSKVVVFKCTGIQKDDVAEKVDDTSKGIVNLDSYNIQTRVFESDKVVDNFFPTYISMISKD